MHLKGVQTIPVLKTDTDMAVPDAKADAAVLGIIEVAEIAETDAIEGVMIKAVIVGTVAIGKKVAAVLVNVKGVIEIGATGNEIGIGIGIGTEAVTETEAEIGIGIEVEIGTEIDVTVTAIVIVNDGIDVKVVVIAIANVIDVMTGEKIVIVVMIVKNNDANACSYTSQVRGNLKHRLSPPRI